MKTFRLNDSAKQVLIKILLLSIISITLILIYRSFPAQEISGPTTTTLFEIEENLPPAAIATTATTQATATTRSPTTTSITTTTKPTTTTAPSGGGSISGGAISEKSSSGATTTSTLSNITTTSTSSTTTTIFKIADLHISGVKVSRYNNNPYQPLATVNITNRGNTDADSIKIVVNLRNSGYNEIDSKNLVDINMPAGSSSSFSFAFFSKQLQAGNYFIESQIYYQERLEYEDVKFVKVPIAQ